MKLVFSHEADQNLTAIADYIAEESGDTSTAISFIEKLIRKCGQLSSHSFQMGTPRLDLGEDIRSYAYGNYLILFRYTPDTMEVAMIVEGHRDIESLF
ncbi:MAG: type II toxin-antitoxin system RelE/ParE family toxin [Lewinellaceae bacterium]|nr:type II toxin-antitoxin system RelE/ParE family toxin [Lewinellaceae bacterium]